MAVQVERIGDVDEGAPPPDSGLDEYGFTAEERAVFDGMKQGETDSSGPEEPEPVVEDPAPEAPAVPPVDPQVPPVAEDDDDAPDVITTDPKTGKTQKTINYGKHQRLITKAQKEAETLRQAAETERLNNAKLAERLQILNEALMAPSPQADPAAPAAPANPMLEPTINVEDDAIAAVAQMQRRQIWMANSSTQAQEQTQEMLEDQQLVADFTRETNAFSATEEGRHFLGSEGAYQYLKNSRLTDLGISLFDKDPTDPAVVFTQAEINQMVSTYNADEKWVVSNALKQNKSPSQAIMKLAKGRGWRPPAAQPAPVPAVPAVVPPAPAARAPAPAARPAPPTPAPSSAAAKLQSEIEGAAASRSLSDGGGSPPAELLSMEMLNRMNDEEFGRYVDSLPRDRLDSIMGKQFPGR